MEVGRTFGCPFGGEVAQVGWSQVFRDPVEEDAATIRGTRRPKTVYFWVFFDRVAVEEYLVPGGIYRSGDLPLYICDICGHTGR